MLDTISALLHRYARGGLVGVLFAGVITFNLVVLPRQEANLLRLSGGTGSLDRPFFYTPEQAYSMIQTYGESGRQAYRTFALTGDILYPILYTLCLGLLMTWLFERGFAPGSSMQKLNIVPLGAWCFDLLENLNIVAMLSLYPAMLAGMAWMAALSTLLKWLFVGMTIILIVLGFGMAWKNRFRRRYAPDLARA